MWCGRLQSLDTKNVNLDRQEISSFSALYKKKNGDCVLFVVTDRGGGINEDEIDKIMEPFYRSEKNINSIRGFGLGLTITKKIVEAHNGSLNVENLDSGGAVFTIKLPIHENWK